MPKSDLVFGSFDTSTSSGKYYKTQPINFPTPERAVEVFTVPGRSGDLVVDYGSYNNVELTAEIVIQATSPDTFLTLYDKLRTAVMVQSGYQRLEDSLYSGEYRMARAVGVEMKQTDTMNGTATITFDAKPQRYLTSGETAKLTVNGTSTGTQAIGIGTDIFNAATISMLETGGADTSALYTVANVSAHSSSTGNIWVRFYFTESHPASTPFIYTKGTSSVLSGETLGGATNYNVQIDNDNMVQFRISPYSGTKYNQVVVQGRVRWDIYNYATDTVLASGTPDTGTLTPVTGVMDYSPLIEIGVSGAVNGTVAYLNDDVIILNTPATIGDIPVAATISEILIDCDTMNAYTVIDNCTYNLNKYVTLDGLFKYPGAAPLVVYINSLIGSIKIVPMWWKL